MAEGFVQVAADGAGKQIDNDVVTIPAGTVVTDGSGNQTTLAAPAYYFRQRIVNADPNDPVALAAVRRSTGPNVDDFGLTVRLPFGNADLQTIAALLVDIDNNIAAMAGNVPLSALSVLEQSQQFALPVLGNLGPPQITPTVPRPIIVDKFGRQIVLTNTIREQVFSSGVTITASTTETTLVPAGAADTYNDLIALIIDNTSATATRVDIRDQLSTVARPASTQVIPFEVPAGDTRGLVLGGTLIPQTNPGQAWTATVITSVTDVRIWALCAQNK